MKVKGPCGLVSARLIGAIGTMQLLAATSWAVETQTAPFEGLEEIVITAQFREQSLQDSPLAVTAISAGMLEAKHQGSVTDLASGAPSVTIQPGSAAWGPAPAISIRGIGSYDFNFAL